MGGKLLCCVTEVVSLNNHNENEVEKRATMVVTSMCKEIGCKFYNTPD